MPDRPAYFERIRAEAAARCDLLERDPILAAPAQQLFKQIRNPRFVLSELLQNADDAGGRHVRVWIADGAFHLEHDGEDFEAEHFASLCRFGFSNKRHLHTIGFRGLGFKSVFSYGSVVQLTTPSLSVRFHEARFTEPVWFPATSDATGTRVSVRFRSQDVARLAADELQRWTISPVPLLFFRSIEELNLGGHVVRRVSRGEGPVPSSEWVELDGTDEGRLLVIRSPGEALPDEEMDEVRGERMDPDFSSADASIQLVFGLKARNRLYVVLPTTVEWFLPFAVNAPFVQDPARTAIKEPAQSPMNRWLLQRAGRLAAETLLSWLRRKDMTVAARAAAYGLLGTPSSTPGTLAGSTGAAVLAAMRESLEGQDLLLTTEDTLTAPGLALDLPSDLVNVWPAEQACGVFGGPITHVMAAKVPSRARDSLAAWEFLSRLAHKDVVERLSRIDVSVPRPDDNGLRVLWAYLASGTRNPSDSHWINQVRIFPAYEEGELRISSELVAPDESVESMSDEDWQYLSTLLPLVDVDWLEFAGIDVADETITEARDYGDRPDGVAVLWAWSELANATELDGLIARAARTVVERKSENADAIRLAHMAARLGASVDDDFPYLTALGATKAGAGVLAPEARDRDLIPQVWLRLHELSGRYAADIAPENLAAWLTWVSSPRSRLRHFSVPARSEKNYHSRKSVEAVYHARGGVAPLAYYYQRNHFVVVDHDFDEVTCKHWESMAAEDPAVWTRVVDALGRNWEAYASSLSLEIQQQGNRYYQKLDADRLPARWLHRLAALPCLPNEFRSLEHPGALLRHTPNTAFLHGVESFVHPDFDRTELHPFLDQLGVRSDPSDAAMLLGRLRALAQAPQPPSEAVLRIYLALDRLFARLPGDRAADVVRVFEAEALIRTDDDGWSTSGAVFVENAEKLPGVAVLWREASSLAFWRQVGIAQRPDTDTILGWLRQRTLGEKLEGPVRQRVRSLLAGMPERVWTTCRAWVDLEDRWVAGSQLRFRTTHPAAWQSLFSSIRMETADVSMLPADCDDPGLFGVLQPLEDVVEQQPLHVVLQPEPQPEWLAVLARSILRVDPNELHAPRPGDQIQTERDVHPDHAMARALLGANWAVAQELQVVPHIERRVVGAHRTVHAVWSGDRIVVVGRQATYYKELVAALNARITTSAVRIAVGACVDRSAVWIEDYFATEFRLRPASLLEEQEHASLPGTPAHSVERPSEQDAARAPVVVRPSLLAAVKIAPEPMDTNDGLAAEPPRDRGGRSGVAWEGTSASAGASPGVHVDPEHTMRVRSHIRSGPVWHGPIVAILEAFGYADLGDGDRFRHIDGGWAVLGTDALAHAVAYDAVGVQRAHFWAGDAPLASGVEVPADVWAFLERSKASSWLVLPDGDGVVAHLLATLDRAIEVYPALYRIRLRTP